MDRIWGMVAPICGGPLGRGTGSAAQPVVAAYGGLAWDVSPQWRGDTSWGEGGSFPFGGRCL